jgi:hypothetical protein
MHITFVGARQICFENNWIQTVQNQSDQKIVAVCTMYSSRTLDKKLEANQIWSYLLRFLNKNWDREQFFNRFASKMQLVNLNVQIWKKFTHDFVPQIPTESKKMQLQIHTWFCSSNSNWEQEMQLLHTWVQSNLVVTEYPTNETELMKQFYCSYPWKTTGICLQHAANTNHSTSIP